MGPILGGWVKGRVLVNVFHLFGNYGWKKIWGREEEDEKENMRGEKKSMGVNLIRFLHDELMMVWTIWGISKKFFFFYIIVLRFL